MLSDILSADHANVSVPGGVLNYQCTMSPVAPMVCVTLLQLGRHDCGDVCRML